VHDKGYDYPETREEMAERGYAEHWLGLIQFAACLIVYRRTFLG